MSGLQPGGALKGGYSSSPAAQQEQCTVLLHYWPRVDTMRGCTAALDSDKLLGENTCSSEAEDLMVLKASEDHQFPIRCVLVVPLYRLEDWQLQWTPALAPAHAQTALLLVQGHLATQRIKQFMAAAAKTSAAAEGGRADRAVSTAGSAEDVLLEVALEVVRHTAVAFVGAQYADQLAAYVFLHSAFPAQLLTDQWLQRTQLTVLRLAPACAPPQTQALHPLSDVSAVRRMVQQLGDELTSRMKAAEVMPGSRQVRAWLVLCPWRAHGMTLVRACP
jgi:hypothetical protein